MSSRRLYPLDVIEGADTLFQLTLYRADGTTYDLTGCTLSSQVRDSDDTLILSINPTAANALTGLVNLNIAGSSTIGKAGEYIWDLKIVNQSGIVDYTDASRFRVRKSITN